MNGLRFLPDRASDFAGSYDFLFMTLTVMTAVLTIGIAAMILFCVVRYRRRPGRLIGADIGDHPGVEITWTVIPLLICLGIFAWGTILYIRSSRPPADSIVVQVIGKQWMWKIQHPSGRKEINELHVPLGRPVKLEMTSQDVIHSFFLPEFRIKQDVIPGRYSEQWLLATKVGEYHLFCSEYCGTSHSQMRGSVIVMEPGDYERWAANAALDDRPEAAGAHLFTQYGCVACHGQQAPTLAGVYGRQQVMDDGQRVTADDNYLRESILLPRARIVAGYSPIMPSYQGQLSEEQVFQLIAYIKSLGAASSMIPNLPAASAPARLPPSTQPETFPPAPALPAPPPSPAETRP